MAPHLCKELWTGPVEVVVCLKGVAVHCFLAVSAVVEDGAAVSQAAQHHTPRVINDDVAASHCPGGGLQFIPIFILFNH